MLVSSRKDWVERARHLASQARMPSPHYEHEEVGYNYRLSNLLAAVGRGQLRSLAGRVQRRREHFAAYRGALGDLPGWHFMPEATYGECNRWLTCVTIDPGPNPTLYGDRDALVTALLNLLDNAWKYSGEHKQITIRTTADAHTVSIAVADQGIGIPRRHLRRIFDRFYQVDRSLTRTAGGTGLGLAIVKFIVEGHHGTIDVTSAPNKGSTFTLRLPVEAQV